MTVAFALAHPDGTSVPTILAETEGTVHLALWSPLLCQTRCGMEFAADPNWVDGARLVEGPVTCMTCIVQAASWWVPLSKPCHNSLDEPMWMKRTFGDPRFTLFNGYITECCPTEAPCGYHETKHP